MNKDIKHGLLCIASIFIIIILLTVWSNMRDNKIGEVTVTDTTSGSSYIPGTHELDKYMDEIGVKKIYTIQAESSTVLVLSLIHISEPTRQAEISYAVFCLKKKKN